MRKIAVGLALANLPPGVNADEIFSFIESNASDIEIYERAPPPPGTMRGAAIDWTLLMATGSAASIADLLWRAYDHFIAPKKKSESDNAGIVIIVRKDNGTSDQFWIGNSAKNQEPFILDFTHKIESMRHTDVAGESTEHVIEELRMKSLWTRRK